MKNNLQNKMHIRWFLMASKIIDLYHVYHITGWERTVHVSRYPALYSGRIFVPLCRELIIFVF